MSRAARCKARGQEMLELGGAAERRRKAENASHHRANRESHQRHGHRPGRFMRPVPGTMAVTMRRVGMRIVAVRSVFVGGAMRDVVQGSVGLRMRERIGWMGRVMDRRDSR